MNHPKENPVDDHQNRTGETLAQEAFDAYLAKPEQTDKSSLESVVDWLLSPPLDKPIDQQSDAEKLVNYLSQPIDRSNSTF
jgi:hypothetical protein